MVGESNRRLKGSNHHASTKKLHNGRRKKNSWTKITPSGAIVLEKMRLCRRVTVYFDKSCRLHFGGEVGDGKIQTLCSHAVDQEFESHPIMRLGIFPVQIPVFCLGIVELHPDCSRLDTLKIFVNYDAYLRITKKN